MKSQPLAHPHLLRHRTVTTTITTTTTHPTIINTHLLDRHTDNQAVAAAAITTETRSITIININRRHIIHHRPTIIHHRLTIIRRLHHHRPISIQNNRPKKRTTITTTIGRSRSRQLQLNRPIDIQTRSIRPNLISRSCQPFAIRHRVARTIVNLAGVELHLLT